MKRTRSALLKLLPRSFFFVLILFLTGCGAANKIADPANPGVTVISGVSAVTIDGIKMEGEDLHAIPGSIYEQLIIEIPPIATENVMEIEPSLVASNNRSLRFVIDNAALDINDPGQTVIQLELTVTQNAN